MFYPKRSPNFANVSILGLNVGTFSFSSYFTYSLDLLLCTEVHIIALPPLNLKTSNKVFDKVSRQWGEF